VTGRLTKVLFHAGATVKQGELLMELDAKPFLKELEKTTLEVEVAEARERVVAHKLKTVKDANAKVAGTVSSTDIGELESKSVEAKATVRVARMEQEEAKNRVAAAKIVAPIGGKISQIVPLTLDRLVEAGSKEPLATIVSLDSVYVSFVVDQNTVLRLRQILQERQAKGGQIGPFTVLCGVNDAQAEQFPYRGKVESMDVPISGGMAHWRAMLSNKDGTLLPGMNARVRLITSGLHDALLIPEQAITLDQGIHYVIVVKEVGEPSIPASRALVAKSILELRPVKTGRSEDSLRVVEEGLTATDRVVVSSSRDLRPGMTVKPTEPPNSAPPNQR
jgi:RND family efflux transporter MFP subunit